jgi:hypothetical protein
LNSTLLELDRQWRDGVDDGSQISPWSDTTMHYAGRAEGSAQSKMNEKKKEIKMFDKSNCELL